MWSYMRGVPLSDQEKEFINKNKEEMFISQMAHELGRHPKTVKSYLRKNELD